MWVVRAGDCISRSERTHVLYSLMRRRWSSPKLLRARRGANDSYQVRLVGGMLEVGCAREVSIHHLPDALRAKEWFARCRAFLGCGADSSVAGRP